MIVTATDRYRLKQFIELPQQIYQNDPNWVRPLVGSNPESFNKNLNKAIETLDIRLFLALDGSSEPVGRIALIIDENHNLLHHEKTAFFGFYESEDSPKTSLDLLKAVEDGAKAAGMSKVVGPVDISTNYQAGFLVDGFTRSTVMTPYNKPYYPKLIEQAGYKKAMDLLSYTFHKNLPIPDKITRITHLLKKKRPELSVRTLDRMPGRKKTAAILTKLYNEAFSDNWGFVPMSDFEFDSLLKSLSAMGHLTLNYVAFSESTPVGLLLTVPDLHENSLLKNRRHQRNTSRLRLTVLGVVPEHRAKGIESLLGSSVLNDALAKGYEEVEFSVILENNIAMNNLINREFGLPVTKTYRVYEKDLT